MSQPVLEVLRGADPAEPGQQPPRHQLRHPETLGDARLRKITLRYQVPPLFSAPSKNSADHAAETRSARSHFGLFTRFNSIGMKRKRSTTPPPPPRVPRCAPGFFAALCVRSETIVLASPSTRLSAETSLAFRCRHGSRCYKKTKHSTHSCHY